ncbi:glucose-6-phosphate isomerase [Neptuniibacter caesariensis]|uniref:Glucose-6-phosphate isomerase n=1 Tax=Neptuniibacter caesariensis TaxID=207954 RepID=A0A7U8C1T4_NEPCE|nr:glucose-6-phosphate isomerase [Neptuniibacter caesariensis]EAR59942.1 Glucose-6-phosphate isomerase [Oceanospirillum sp. MED92] [Neptuniibacter caesariensis]
MPANESVAWNDLQSHAYYMSQSHISTLFREETDRFSLYTFEQNKFLLDLSKQRITEETLALLIKLAEEKGLQQWIQKLFDGDHVNDSEDRPALHTALRTPADRILSINDKNIIDEVHSNLSRMEEIVERIHSGQWRGFTGHSIDTVVNIGVGGSDLGPFMACKALAENQADTAKSLKIHFVSSMDGSQLAELLSELNPARTLFVISSKSFTTIDTLANAQTAKEWLKKSSYAASEETLISRHFIGVSANPDKVCEWGIPKSNQLEFWDWTGGRYSMWSTIGLPIALKLGMSGFREFLNGAHEMDEHFRNAAFSENLPVLLAMAGIWNINFLNINAHAILPYDGRLSHIPAYLEQLEMESNGKSVDRQGNNVDYKTCPILWGEVGTNAQHAFYQLLHQGTEAVMCDFIVAARRYHDTNNPELQHQHQLNLANCLAQSRILALGDSVLEGAESAPAFKRYKGNQPCTTIMLDELNPFSFGQLIALYEHKVFVQSVIWDINPFDQWGVELGKKVATSLLDALGTERKQPDFDSSTNGLINRITERGE